ALPTSGKCFFFILSPLLKGLVEQFASGYAKQLIAFVVQYCFHHPQTQILCLFESGFKFLSVDDNLQYRGRCGSIMYLMVYRLKRNRIVVCRKSTCSREK